MPPCSQTTDSRRRRAPRTSEPATASSQRFHKAGATAKAGSAASGLGSIASHGCAAGRPGRSRSAGLCAPAGRRRPRPGPGPAPARRLLDEPSREAGVAGQRGQQAPPRRSRAGPAAAWRGGPAGSRCPITAQASSTGSACRSRSASSRSSSIVQGPGRPRAAAPRRGRPTAAARGARAGASGCGQADLETAASPLLRRTGSTSAHTPCRARRPGSAPSAAATRAPVPAAGPATSSPGLEALGRAPP